ncbi:uncharacterized protein B0T15DRAFT_43192 [Chaetomium strumarium]|uniref:Uncharacterized protein n=1 Tax=Chaetomium strumarium TaxID=1170767 RepID=A0AAJ0H2I5_9PEZI|nr:hypothetical protein B0T15DRAFT_43192 [Chaetomium strumarium]
MHGRIHQERKAPRQARTRSSRPFPTLRPQDAPLTAPPLSRSHQDCPPLHLAWQLGPGPVHTPMLPSGEAACWTLISVIGAALLPLVGSVLHDSDAVYLLALLACVPRFRADQPIAGVQHDSPDAAGQGVPSSRAIHPFVFLELTESTRCITRHHSLYHKLSAHDQAPFPRSRRLDRLHRKSCRSAQERKAAASLVMPAS